MLLLRLDPRSPSDKSNHLPCRLPWVWFFISGYSEAKSDSAKPLYKLQNAGVAKYQLHCFTIPFASWRTKLKSTNSWSWFCFSSGRKLNFGWPYSLDYQTLFSSIQLMLLYRSNWEACSSLVHVNLLLQKLYNWNDMEKYIGF